MVERTNGRSGCRKIERPVSIYLQCARRPLRATGDNKRASRGSNRPKVVCRRRNISKTEYLSASLVVELGKTSSTEFNGAGVVNRSRSWGVVPSAENPKNTTRVISDQSVFKGSIGIIGLNTGIDAIENNFSGIVDNSGTKIQCRVTSSSPDPSGQRSADKIRCRSDVQCSPILNLNRSLIVKGKIGNSAVGSISSTSSDRSQVRQLAGRYIVPINARVATGQIHLSTCSQSQTLIAVYADLSTISREINCVVERRI